MEEVEPSPVPGKGDAAAPRASLPRVPAHSPVGDPPVPVWSWPAGVLALPVQSRRSVGSSFSSLGFFALLSRRALFALRLSVRVCGRRAGICCHQPVNAQAGPCDHFLETATFAVLCLCGALAGELTNATCTHAGLGHSLLVSGSSQTREHRGSCKRTLLGHPGAFCVHVTFSTRWQ